MSQEGVIKFQLDFQSGPAPAPDRLQELNAWRELFRRLGQIGQDPSRYEGLGFGNLSRRLDETGDRFLITGTQTGPLPALQPEHYVTVDSCDPDRNRLCATGPIRPSSESLSHAVLYQSVPTAHWVMHLHGPDIFHAASDLALPQTKPDIPYGTPAMAAAIRDLARRMEPAQPHLIVMGGHEDGLLAWGPTADATGLLVIRTLVAALAIQS